MTEREMLEAAAKAAGYQITGWVNDVDGSAKLAPDNRLWEPFYDDGDAARLRTKLRLGVEWLSDGVTVIVWTSGRLLRFTECFTNHNNDPDAALRWSTVRAASEVKG